MRRHLFLALPCYILFLLAIVSFRRELLALAVPMVVFLAGALLRGPELLRLSASRSLSEHRVTRGTPVKVRLSIKNEGRALERVWVEDLIPEDMVVIEGASRLLTALGAGESVTLEYTVRGGRGGAVFDQVRVVASDLLGIFRREVVLSAPARLLVLPEVPKLDQVTIRPLRTHGFAGPIPARRGGAGVEFLGVREYQVGDALRWINWRASARHPRALFTTEFEQERVADVGLILDARKRTDVHVGTESLFEHAVEATAALAHAFLHDGNRVGLLVYGWFLDWTFPGYGKVQQERIIRSLARARTGDSIVFDTLDYLPMRFFPARSQIVVISPLCADDPPVLIRLRARGYHVLVVSPDPVSFQAAALDDRPEVAFAVRMARLERRLLVRRLERAGIRVVEWPVQQPLARTIHGSLRRLPVWMRTAGRQL